MKINLFLWVSLLTCSLLLSQERRPIKGKLLYKNTVVVAANVVNNSAQTNTITDSEGEFEIEVAEVMRLYFHLFNTKFVRLQSPLKFWLKIDW